MARLRAWSVRFLSLFRRRQLDRRLDEELRFHLDMQARDNQARGMSPEAARRAARLSFAAGGSVEPLKEEYRARRGVPALETLAQDLRYAARMMRKSPGFTAVALLSLAFGIGTNCAIFSVVDALLLKPLPVPEADRLAVLAPSAAGQDLPQLFSYPAFRRLEQSAAVTAGVVAFTADFQTLVRAEDGLGAAGDDRDFARTQLVSGNFFSVLGAGTAAGRTFDEAEDMVPGGHPVAVISHGYWQRAFGRDPRIAGRVLRVNGAAVTIVGVAARDFFGVYADASPDIFLPLTLRDLVKYRGNTWVDGPADLNLPAWQQINLHWLRLMARRRPGVGVQQASSVLNVLFQPDKEAQAATREDAQERADVLAQKIALLPGGRGLAESRERLGRPLVTLMAVAGLVLLIACANVANLLLARADRRRREMAVRLGIGAGRARLVRQLLTESLLLAGLGGALGLAFAYSGSRFLVALVGSADGSLRLDVALDGRKLLFAGAAALATGLVFGLAPALQATRVELAASLQQGARALAGDGRGRRRLPFGRLLVAAQIGLSLLLLIGAGLFVRSLQNLMAVDPGFDRDRLVQVSLNARLLGYDENRLAALDDRLLERLAAAPGVRSAGLSLCDLLSGDVRTSTVFLPGFTPRGAESMETHAGIVTPGYFATAGMAVASGRDFLPRDRQGAPEVAVVNQTFARRFLAHRPALGQRFGFGRKHDRQYEVVGVVRDAKYNRLGDATPPMAFFPAAQNRDEVMRSLLVRVAPGASVSTVAAELRRVVAQVNPDLAVLGVATMGDMVDRSLARQRAIARLIGFFGLLALLLAAIGLYGVMSYSVARRTSEIGLRMALGAMRGGVLRLVLAETARLVAAGLAGGLIAALAVTRLAASQLFGIAASDPATIAVATLVMAVVALVAGFLPARRAADTEPMAALRYE
jgi:predicted permease